MKIKIHLGSGELKSFTEFLTANGYAFSSEDDALSATAEEEEKIETENGLDSSPAVPSELLLAPEART